MNKKSLLAIICLTALLLTSTGCIQNNDDNTKQLQVQDDLNRNVTIPKEVNNVVSLAPSNTEILFALGQGPKVVGVTNYADYPSEAKYKTRVGGFQNPSLEKIISLDPDIVFASTRTGEQTVQNLEENGIPVYVTNPESLEDVFKDIKDIGKIVGAEEYSKQLTDEMEKRMENLSNRVNDYEEKKVFYLMSTYGGNIWTAGKNTFINELIEKSRGENIAKDLNGYKKINLATVLEKEPDVILTTKHSGINIDDLENKTGWKQLEAVQENNIYVLTEDKLVRPGPRLIDGLEEMTKAIHPNAFE